MRDRSGILAGGNWIVDKLKIIDTYPQQDALANILSQSVGNGGSPFNVLMDLAKLGAKFSLAGIGLVGRDSEGAWILEQCGKHGIDVAQLRAHEEAPTSCTDVMTVQATGRRTFFHQRGANAFLVPSHFDFAVSRARIFHLGYLLLLDGLDQPDAAFGTIAARLLDQAGKSGIKTSIDVVSEDSQRFASVVLPALRHVDYCILNEFEIERTTGIATRPNGEIDLTAVNVASRQLLAAGVREWVVVHFPEGASALGHDGIFRVQGSLRIPQPEIVSTVGGGDAFAAGVLYGLHENEPMETALRYGVASAASCLMGIGTSDGVRPLAECLQLESAFGSRDLKSS
jgi:sugar/nucleoside kinase (ribokinase family)